MLHACAGWGPAQRQAEKVLRALGSFGFASQECREISFLEISRLMADQHFKETSGAVEAALTSQQLVWCARNLQVGRVDP